MATAQKTFLSNACQHAGAANGLALSRFSVIYATPPCVITQRSPVQGSCAVQEHLCLTRPYVSKARTLGLRAVATNTNSAYSWQCTGPGVTLGIDVTAECRTQYGYGAV